MTLLPQIGYWYYGFFVSMGSLLAVATAFVFAVLVTHWLYLCARRIESKPTSPSFSTTMMRLSGFQALVTGRCTRAFRRHYPLLSPFSACVEARSGHALHAARRGPLSKLRSSIS